MFLDSENTLFKMKNFVFCSRNTILHREIVYFFPVKLARSREARESPRVHAGSRGLTRARAGPKACSVLFSGSGNRTPDAARFGFQPMWDPEDSLACDKERAEKEQGRERESRRLFEVNAWSPGTYDILCLIAHVGSYRRDVSNCNPLCKDLDKIVKLSVKHGLDLPHGDLNHRQLLWTLGDMMHDRVSWVANAMRSDESNYAHLPAFSTIYLLKLFRMYKNGEVSLKGQICGAQIIIKASYSCVMKIRDEIIAMNEQIEISHVNAIREAHSRANAKGVPVYKQTNGDLIKVSLHNRCILSFQPIAQHLCFRQLKEVSTNFICVIN